MKVAFLLLSTLLVAINCQSEEKEWWRTATFYQVYPRSFMDTTGNGIGDLQGIIDRMDHLKDAGIDTFWLSPVFKSPQKDTGYDVSDFYQIEPDYGNMEDFDNLLAKAKTLGIRVLLDFIPNHTSDQHDWFVRSKNNESIYRDYYVWHDGLPNPIAGERPLLPNNWMSVFSGPAWTWVETRKQYYLHQFYPEQPDLNYRNPQVQAEMSEMLKFYIDRGVSGFRLDAINHMFEHSEFPNEPKSEWVEDRPGWWQPNNYEELEHIHTKDLNETFDFVYYWRNLIDEYRIEKGIETDILIMTEAYASIEDTMRYYRDPINENRRGAHMPFNFQLIWAFQQEGNATNLKGNIDWFRDHMPSGETANWVAGSHDHSRVASRVGENYIHVVNTIVTTLPGASINYYGEEIGMHDYNDVPNWDGRNKNRTPMQWSAGKGAGFTTKEANETWLPINPNYVEINLESQKNTNGSTFKYYQTLTALRKKAAFREGSYRAEVIAQHVFAHAREHGAEAEGFIVVVNLASTQETVDLSVFDAFRKSELLVVTAAPNSQFKAGQTVQKKSVTLSPYDAVVFDYSSASGVVASFIVIMMTSFLTYILF